MPIKFLYHHYVACRPGSIFLLTVRKKAPKVGHHVVKCGLLRASAAVLGHHF